MQETHNRLILISSDKEQRHCVAVDTNLLYDIYQTMELKTISDSSADNLELIIHRPAVYKVC